MTFSWKHCTLLASSSPRFLRSSPCDLILGWYDMATHQGQTSEDGTLGIYFERRRILLTCLKRLLEMNVSRVPPANPEAHSAVKMFTRALLEEEAEGKGKVLSRVVTLIQVMDSSQRLMGCSSHNCCCCWSNSYYVTLHHTMHPSWGPMSPKLM